jgi:hypothetical protein
MMPFLIRVKLLSRAKQERDRIVNEQVIIRNNFVFMSVAYFCRDKYRLRNINEQIMGSGQYGKVL